MRALSERSSTHRPSRPSGIFGKPIDRDFRLWKSGSPFEVGPFRITPHLTDHSAFDAHMLLIEVQGKRLLYSGDFRTHGRKSPLVDRFMAAPPSDIDVLLMEGTNRFARRSEGLCQQHATAVAGADSWGCLGH
ncbi:hypothetical protein [Tunturiibacter gelidiferens]|uniref:hypothetical protein n=1 Tax=Tunturiibacter gelidiferens TaxID=3069689 RepID=UPI003D9BB795